MFTIMDKTAAIFLSGGIGKRIGLDIPKQYLKLNGKPIALYSFETFVTHPQIQEIIVVCDDAYKDLFLTQKKSKLIKFAKPGPERQDSFFSGLKAVSDDCEFVMSHDAARPFITHKMIDDLLDTVKVASGATLAMPVKFTVKQVGENLWVDKTLERSHLMEIQTPQIGKKYLFEQAILKLKQSSQDVTDDVSLLEILGESVKIVYGSYGNIKITTQDDLFFATQLIKQLSHA